MHETSIAISLLKELKKIQSELAYSSVSKVEVKVGILSGIQPYFLTEALAILVKDSEYQRVEWNILPEPICFDCHACGQTSLLYEINPICGYCNSHSGKWSGNYRGLYITKLTQ